MNGNVRLHPYIAPVDVELWTAAIGGVAGLATGAISALAAPWAKWSVDKKRIRLEHRYGLLTSWRDGLAEYRLAHYQLPSQGWYQQLRPYLTPSGVASAEAPHVPTMTDAAHQARLQAVASTLADEIKRIESEWKLDK